MLPSFSNTARPTSLILSRPCSRTAISTSSTLRPSLSRFFFTRLPSWTNNVGGGSTRRSKAGQRLGRRSGEGRVGEEGRSRWWSDHLKKKKPNSLRSYSYSMKQSNPLVTCQTKLASSPPTQIRQCNLLISPQHSIVIFVHRQTQLLSTTN